ncbi:MAG: hypothetical protein U0835_03910 [Isosphaeraceae bacterium]
MQHHVHQNAKGEGAQHVELKIPPLVELPAPERPALRGARGGETIRIVAVTQPYSVSNASKNASSQKFTTDIEKCRPFGFTPAPAAVSVSVAFVDMVPTQLKNRPCTSR